MQPPNTVRSRCFLCRVMRGFGLTGLGAAVGGFGALGLGFPRADAVTAALAGGIVAAFLIARTARDASPSRQGESGQQPRV